MKLPPEDVQRRVAELGDWQVDGEALVRTYVFDGFPDAVMFITRLAFDAEAADHHPDLQVNYRRVRVSWSTHSEGGLTEKDFAGVAQSDRIAGQCGSRPATARGKSPR